MKGIHMMRLGSVWAVERTISRSTVKKLQDMLMLAAILLMVFAQDFDLNGADPAQPIELRAHVGTIAMLPVPG